MIEALPSRNSVSRAFCRPSSDLPPVARSRLPLKRGLGVVGDCHAGAMSSRQLLLTATGAYRRLELHLNNLRENLLIDAEQLDWPSGSKVTIGTTVVLRIMFVCEPCAKLNPFRMGLVRDVGSDRGVLARVIRGGVVVAGDTVKVTPGIYEPYH